MPMIRKESMITSHFAEKKPYTCYDKEDNRNKSAMAANNDQNDKYSRDQGKASSSAFGPMFRDRDHFNSMHSG